MSGLRGQIEALRDEAKRRYDEPDQGQGMRFADAGRFAALCDVLALLAEQLPKRWSAEVATGPEGWEFYAHDGDRESFCIPNNMSQDQAESLAAQINGEA